MKLILYFSLAGFLLLSSGRSYADPHEVDSSDEIYGAQTTGGGPSAGGSPSSEEERGVSADLTNASIASVE